MTSAAGNVTKAAINLVLANQLNWLETLASWVIARSNSEVKVGLTYLEMLTLLVKVTLTCQDWNKTRTPDIDCAYKLTTEELLHIKQFNTQSNAWKPNILLLTWGWV